MISNKKGTIMFLSLNDFKENSIQVILKTPEAYVKNGWEVFYIVARDMSKNGNYYYEPEINPDGVKVIRFTMPLTQLANKITSKIGSLILYKFRYWMSILIMFKKAKKIMKKYNVDIIYGYEVHGILPAKLVRFFNFKRRNVKYVNRFQGTFMYDYISRHKIKKLLIRLEDFIALKTKCDLIIMTNDGTNGDKALKLLNPKTPFLFLVNGVDEFQVDQNDIKSLNFKYNIQEKVILLSVSRLVKWKRVENNLRVVHNLVFNKKFKNIKYLVVGEGPEKENLISLTKELNIKNYIEFVGAVPNEKLGPFYKIADYFISTYEGSNVGNPLLEALLNEKIIYTLSNGDTGSWIKHGYNGFIYDENTNFIDEISKDIIKIESNLEYKNEVILNIRKINQKKLWTWKERMQYEVQQVEKVINNS